MSFKPRAVRIPEWNWTVSARYEQAVVTGPLVRTCGVAPFAADGDLVGPGDFDAQMRTVVSNLGRILEASGSSMELIVRQYVYLRRTEDLPVFLRLRDELYAPPYPASVTVVVVAMAHPEMLIEIAVDAVTSEAAGRRAPGDLDDGPERAETNRHG